MSEVQRTVAFAEEAINDLILITEYLTQAYCGFGEPLAEANRHAQLRIVPSIGFVHGLSSAKSRCWPCPLVAKTTSATCWCGCAKQPLGLSLPCPPALFDLF